jgi:butyryl-CoA dehydrogenase
MEEGAGLKLLASKILSTIDKASKSPVWSLHAQSLKEALNQLVKSTQQAWSSGQANEALANAVPYLQAFGHLVLAWTWLDVVASTMGPSSPSQLGREAAAKYFFHYELPKIDAWLKVVSLRDMTCANLPEEAF